MFDEPTVLILGTVAGLRWLHDTLSTLAGSAPASAELTGLPPGTAPLVIRATSLPERPPDERPMLVRAASRLVANGPPLGLRFQPDAGGKRWATWILEADCWAMFADQVAAVLASAREHNHCYLDAVDTDDATVMVDLHHALADSGRDLIIELADPS